MPAKNFRIEIGSTFAGHDISGVPDLDDRRQLAWQGASLDLRYRFLDRETRAVRTDVRGGDPADRIDETSGAAGRNYGTEFTLAFDRE